MLTINAKYYDRYLTNATAIGYNAKVQNSYTIQLGSTSVTNVKTSGTYTAGSVTYSAKVRIDTPGEADYYRHGGIMQYVLRSLLAE